MIPYVEYIEVTCIIKTKLKTRSVVVRHPACIPGSRKTNTSVIVGHYELDARSLSLQLFTWASNLTRKQSNVLQVEAVEARTAMDICFGIEMKVASCATDATLCFNAQTCNTHDSKRGHVLFSPSFGTPFGCALHIRLRSGTLRMYLGAGAPWGPLWTSVNCAALWDHVIMCPLYISVQHSKEA